VLRSACALFNICTGIFLEKNVETGKVIVLDEAHKVSNLPDLSGGVFLLLENQYLPPTST
jgi:hypothetical protein